MLHFSKTELGLQVLKDRSIPLNARQRQLLLLIGTPDLAVITEATKARIAQPEILDLLFEKGLIINRNLSNIETAKINTNVSNKYTLTTNQNLVQAKVENTSNEIQEANIKDENIELNTILSFEDVKELMIKSLQEYCGLLAKPLIIQIENALNLEILQRCRMQWITHLQESKIHPNQLNFYLQHINYSLVKITNK